MPRVAALIVTRNRIDLLVECLEALLAQTLPVSQVIVFDNASSDGTVSRLEATGWIGSGAVRYERSDVNLGGAGGFAEVLRLGLETDVDWLWLMDDDAEPRRDALQRLLEARVAEDPSTAAVCGAVVHLDGSIDPLHRCRIGRFVTPLPLSAYGAGVDADVPCASFVGLLVRRDAAQRAGLPRREFFLGYDDAEYSLRLTRDGERIRLVPGSEIVHKIVIGGGEATWRSRLWNRLLGAHYTASPWPSYWKDLYRVRNLVAMLRDHGRLGPGGLVVLTLGYIAKTAMYEDRPWRRIPWLLRFIAFGWTGCFRAPTPESWAARFG